jgi:5,10-methylenetetrahydromethanopterin reductase
MAVEFWTMGGGRPTSSDPSVHSGVRQAVRAEELGYDGIVYVDSQNLVGDCYVAMALAAHATSRVKLGTGVTNSYTRHAAITASAIATVQAESDGRAYLGIGRGDSALAHLGLAPHAVPAFERYLERLQAYLRGEVLPFDGGDVEALGLADSPEASHIRWIASVEPKVPVDVAATGPRVIAAAARHADRISLNVGADVERVRWGMDVARATREEAGLDGDIPFTAYLPLVVHDDPEEAMQIGAGQVSLFARFSNMYGSVVGPASQSQRGALEAIHDAYDMHAHGRPGSPQDLAATSEFSRDFGVFGSPDYCVDRLAPLIDAGVDRFILRGSPTDPANPNSAVSERFVKEVARQLR